MEANLRFAGPETMETKIFARLSAWQNWIFQRPNATGPEGALKLYGTGKQAKYDRKRANGSSRRQSWPSTTASSFPTTSTSPPTAACSARSRTGSRASSTGGRTWGRTARSNFDVYLRTAISAEANGWANFGYVKMPDYRWGIFLAGQDPNRVIAYGDNKGKPAWQEVPGELRSTLRRLIVTQGDTEPASVEQQRLLGKTAPSLYDLRNLFQINCEEGRHLWAMVYLLHAYFGRDGREEAEMLLERHSGDPDKPRILGAFNEKTPDWLSFFMFTYFTDRDGKYQLASLAESGFDPLARSCRFMLIEEAHHMFVGESGVQRIVQRTCDLMKEHKTDDVRSLGAIDLPTMQKYLNFHFSVSLDLFGQEASTNAANYYTMGVKGRYLETRIERRPSADRRHLRHRHRRGRPHRAQDRAGAVGAERAAAQRLCRGLRQGPAALEQGDRAGRHRLRAEAAAPRLQPPHRRLRRACTSRPTARC